MEKENEFLEQVTEDALQNNTEALERAKLDLDIHKHAAEELAEEIELQIKINEVVKKNPKPLELTYHYQKEDEFWELNKQLNDIAFNRKLMELRMRLDKSYEIVKAKEDEVKRLSGE